MSNLTLTLQENLAASAFIRDEAVRIVDQRHHFTFEMAPSPAEHLAEYIEEELNLLDSLLTLSRQAEHQALLETLVETGYTRSPYCPGFDNPPYSAENYSLIPSPNPNSVNHQSATCLGCKLDELLVQSSHLANHKTVEFVA